MKLRKRTIKNTADSTLRIPKKVLSVGLVVGLLIVAVLIRVVFVQYESIDYVQFLQPWYAALSTQGFAAFGTEFANYNFPYLYLLYIASILNIPDIIAVKGISTLFDFVLAFSIYTLIVAARKSKKLALAGALLSLYIPTIILNSAAWGQCDAIFTSFLIFSLAYALNHKFKLSWLFWGIAFAFKLQAIFFLPILVLIWLTSKESQKWFTPVFAFIPYVVSIIPPLIAGRSVSSTLGVYINQQGTYEHLTLNAANMYQWLNDSLYQYFNIGGILFTLAVVCVLMYIFINKKITPNVIILSATIFTLIIPFLLPQMHERYIYTGLVLLLVYVTLNLNRAWIFITIELVSIASVIPFLFGITSPIPFPFLALLQLIAIGALVLELLATRPPQTRKLS